MFAFSAYGLVSSITALHFQVRGIINTNQQKDQQQDYPGLVAGRNGTRCNPETDCRREGRKGYLLDLLAISLPLH